MKLHLPTVLFALAVLPAVAFAEDIVDNNKGSYHNITPDNLQGFIDIDVPDIESSVDWSDCHPGTGADSSCPYKDVVVHPISERVAKIVVPDASTGGTGTLVLKDGDKITAGNNSKVLYVDGNVSLESGAKVYQAGGGGNGSGQLFKPGMIAKNVSVSEGASMELDAARFDSLTVTGGTVTLRGTKAAHGGGSLHGSGSETSDFGISGAFEFSNAHIAGDLNVQGGTVTIGRDTAASSLNRVSYISSTYYQGVIGGTIKQSGGTLYIKGMTYLNDGQIEQTGGTMQIAEKTNAYAAYLRVGSDTMTVNQAGDASTVLNLNGIIVNGSTGQGNMQLLINQSGEGTINMSTLEKRVEVNSDKTVYGGYKGSYFTSELGKESLISQSGSGQVNIGSDYQSATFNVEQKGEGSVTLKEHGVLRSSVVSINDKSTFTVAAGGKLMLNEGAQLNLTVGTGSVGLQVANGGSITSASADSKVVVNVLLTEDAMKANITLDQLATLLDGTATSLTFSVDIAQFGTAADAEAFAGMLTMTGNEQVLTYTPDVATFSGEGAVPTDLAITVTGFTNAEGMVQAQVSAKRYTAPVPEPATATLSLLALAGLCARRRRK